ncbi:hypothetical protein V1512DRAFT_255706 [Lipomyces arxii]|uniref:mitochondrial 54S ribosomal protein uL23m n=1 Tax=Lipomyces arxii TaxID=56418 RepID=UPI0034CF3E0D
MPRKVLPDLPSTSVLRQLYYYQSKPPSKFAPSKKQLDTQHRQQKLKEREKVPIRRTSLFRLGHTEVHFPNQFVTLLRPFESDYNPYRATFKVPLTFNKFDLRDYLHNIYSLTVKDVYSNLKVNRTKRTLMKFMTVEMEEPFVHPPLPESYEAWNLTSSAEVVNYVTEASYRYGSSNMKNKVFKAFEGIGQPEFPKVKPYTPKNAARALLKKSRQVDAAFDSTD